MSKRVINLLVGACLVLSAAVGSARGGGDGTLPLRLGGDGTLPLRLSGPAMSMQGPQRQVMTEIVITRAVQQEMTAAEGTSLTCQLTSADVSKHRAAGTLIVATLSFNVKGICYNSADQTMEVVAERQINGTNVERSFVVGRLVEELPRNLSGRLTVTGESGTAGRYVLDLAAPE